MSLWEYKVITSGKGGFATPALLEKFLNDLGRDEWEIVCFQAAPDNFLAFTGLARRSTQRDWTLEDAAAAAAKAEAEKLRAEFEAKFRAANQPAAAATEERSATFLDEKVAPDDGFRRPVDTSRDDEPEAAEDEKDDWDKLSEEDELPTFFDAIKPHMRRNQRGPGMSVGVDYLAKKWDQSEDDLKAALTECGFVVPADEDAKAEYLEYDGDLYWLNINRRGELWINTKEKPRPVFRSVKATRIEVEAPAPAAPKPAADEAAGGGEKSEAAERKPENGGEAAATNTGGKPPRGEKSEGGSQPLPAGPALLDKIRPHMRRNRRGPGGSGSTNFLSRALRSNEADLKAAFATLGLTIPSSAADKPAYTEIGNEVWWLNLDSRGGLWINGREKRPGENLADAAETPADPAAGAAPAGEAGAATADAPASTEASAVPAETTRAALAGTEQAREVAPEPAAVSAAPAADSNAASPVLASVRPLLKESKSGGFAAKAERLAEETGKSVDDLIASLVGAGLKAPEKPREKPVVVEHAGEKFWLHRNGRGELWLNAKPAKADGRDEEIDEADEGDDADGEGAEGGGDSDADAEKKPRRTRSRSKKSE